MFSNWQRVVNVRIVIRCDASIQIGSGHVIRCLTLANALREKGADITFICREHPGHLLDVIESSNHKAVRLPLLTLSTEGALAHAQWLGASQAQDADQTADVLMSFGPIDLLIVDHYALDFQWEIAMRAFTKHIMVIDDLADRKHDCDVLLDLNLYHGMEGRYDHLVPVFCKKLLGPKYALLRPEFENARGKLNVRDGHIRRIFVFFGGSDLGNETGKALRALQKLDMTSIAVDVVISAGNPHQDEIVCLSAMLPDAKLHRQVNNIAQLMARADLAIGAGGGTMWERCCLRLPAIVMSIAKNQQPGCEAVARSGGILYLGDANGVGMELLERALTVALSAPELLASMAEVGSALVDGQGVRRIAKLLMAPSITLRLAESTDCECVFNWRNAEKTRQFALRKNPITYDEHVAWFRKALENPDIQILIGESNEEAVGVLRFDRNEICAVISVYLVPGYYGKGIGVHLIEQGISWVRCNWPNIDSIEGTIMAGNSASISAFSDAGFNLKSNTFMKLIKK